MKKLGLSLLALALLTGLVLAGCGDGNEKEKEEQKETGFTLTVTGLPAADSGKVYGATLMTGTPPSPVAVGVPGNPVNKFTFYSPDSTGMPDTKKPFSTAGDYTLMLALTNMSNPTSPEKIYAYTGGTVTYSASKKDVTVTWSNTSFVEMTLTP